MAQFSVVIEDIPLSNTYGEPTALSSFCKCLNFYSKIFLLPFTIKWVEQEKRYQLMSRSLLAKFLSFLYLIGNMLMLFMWTRVSFSAEDIVNTILSDTGVIFVIAGLLIILTWCAIINFYFIIWFRPQTLIKFLNSIVSLVSTSLLFDHSFFTTSFLKSPLHWVLPVVFYALGVLNMAFTLAGKFTTALGSKMAVEWTSTLVTTILFLEPSETPQLFESFLQIFQTIVKFIIIFGSISPAAIQAIVLSLVISLRLLGKQLENTVCAKKATLPISSILIIYDKIVAVSHFCNATFGGLVLTAYLGSVVYTIQTPLWWLLVGRNAPSKHEKFNSVWYLVVSAVIWWLAGEWHRLVHRSFRKVIQSSLRDVNTFSSNQRPISVEDRLKYVALSNALNSYSIALSCKYFAVTHHLISKTCGAIFTYGIIVLQLLTPATQNVLKSHLNATKEALQNGS